VDVTNGYERDVARGLSCCPPLCGVFPHHDRIEYELEHVLDLWVKRHLQRLVDVLALIRRQANELNHARGCRIVAPNGVKVGTALWAYDHVPSHAIGGHEHGLVGQRLHFSRIYRYLVWRDRIRFFFCALFSTTMSDNVPLCKHDYFRPVEMIEYAKMMVPDEDAGLDLLLQRIEQRNVTRGAFLEIMQDICGKDVLRAIIGMLRSSITETLKRGLVLLAQEYNIDTLRDMLRNAEGIKLSTELLDTAKRRLEYLVNLYSEFNRYGLTVSEDLKCPITKEIMREPVTASDGHNYEREAIRVHLMTSSVSPMTSNYMINKTLIPNHGISERIKNSWAEKIEDAKKGFALRVQQEKNMLASHKAFEARAAEVVHVSPAIEPENKKRRRAAC
jgi:hypothetical protein